MPIAVELREDVHQFGRTCIEDRCHVQMVADSGGISGCDKDIRHPKGACSQEVGLQTEEVTVVAANVGDDLRAGPSLQGADRCHRMYPEPRPVGYARGVGVPRIEKPGGLRRCRYVEGAGQIDLDSHGEPFAQSPGEL
jgi:hypothetical protein